MRFPSDKQRIALNICLIECFYLQSVEDVFRREANLTDIPEHVPGTESDVSSVLAAYKSEGDPDLYENSFLELRRFVDESLDIYKVSIRSIRFENHD